jgi:hypothetical protein
MDDVRYVLRRSRNTGSRRSRYYLAAPRLHSTGWQTPIIFWINVSIIFYKPAKDGYTTDKATTELLRNCLQYPVQRYTTTGRLPHSTRTTVFSKFIYESHRIYDINIKSFKKLANSKIPEEAGDSEHATLYNTGTMETTDKAKTTKTVHRTQNKVRIPANN